MRKFELDQKVHIKVTRKVGVVWDCTHYPTGNRGYEYLIGFSDGEIDYSEHMLEDAEEDEVITSCIDCLDMLNDAFAAKRQACACLNKLGFGYGVDYDMPILFTMADTLVREDRIMEEQARYFKEQVHKYMNNPESY